MFFYIPYVRVCVATCSLKPGNTGVLETVETVLWVGAGVQGVQGAQAAWSVLTLTGALTQCQQSLRQPTPAFKISLWLCYCFIAWVAFDKG